jgi:serine/threonine protein kinase
MCAPNDVWSLGVILVNLTCGRNPWKQASYQDSTYRAYMRSPDFLKTILPLSDDLNAILGRIFDANPETRISLPELRNRILACSGFTVPVGMQQQAVAAPPTPPATPDHITEYVCAEDAIVDDYDYDAPLSPASTSSDEGSLTSSVSTIDDLDEEFVQEQQPQQVFAKTYETVEPRTHHQPVYHGQEFVPQQYTGPVPIHPVMAPQQPIMCQQVPMPLPMPVPVPVQAPMAPVQQAPCQPKSYMPLWDMVKYVQQVPIMQHTGHFHPQMNFLPSFHGCY